MKKLILAAFFALAACASEQQVGEDTAAYVGRQVDEVDMKWTALEAVVDKAQADGVEVIDLDDSMLSYLRLLCDAALVGVVVAGPNPAPTVFADIDWALVPIHIARACKIALKIATPVTVPTVIEVEDAT